MTDKRLKSLDLDPLAVVGCLRNHTWWDHWWASGQRGPSQQEWRHPNGFYVVFSRYLLRLLFVSSNPKKNIIREARWLLKAMSLSLPTCLAPSVPSSGAFSWSLKYGTTGSKKIPLDYLDWWYSYGQSVPYLLGFMPLWRFVLDNWRRRMTNQGCRQKFNIPLQIQPQIFGVLALSTWAQILIYNKYAWSV